jgi:N utilization substance protein B
VPPAGGRSDARERALALLYEAEMKGEPGAAVVAALPVPPDPYAAALVQGVDAERERIDELLRRFTRSWPLERMPALDRAVLRLATYELLARPDVPTAVVIDEAVELAKRFSTDDSGRFVNGMLSSISREVRRTQG